MRHRISVLLIMVLISACFLMSVAAPAQAADSTYRVQRGDTLSDIAVRFNVTVSEIAQANAIVNVNNIYAGQVLKIPTQGQTTNTASNTSQTTGDEAYIVQAGDSLTSVAARFGVSISQLASANNLSVMSYLYIGQTIRIPGQAAAPKPQPTTAPATPVPTTVLTTMVATTEALANTKASTGSVKHKVVAGETLSSIAAYYHVNVSDIVQANNLADPNVINVGQELIIPSAQGGQGGAPAPTKTPETPQAANSVNPLSDGKWIDVNISQQRLVAYEGDKAVFSSLVSTGVTGLATPVGTFQVYVKYQSQLMTGGSGASYYYLPNVPYVMYFYQAYAIHGTYWHNNFGHPMSHGCVNLPTPASQWIYNWAPMGTQVNIHY
ncbi:MAG: LysM peptidoglycan-binding domain-containing protein [Chloroflexi bacterium]|uniref:LysM peptidoglycan-binding domain-containing protein n=1 Tax=Candidatus Chlorohelix allophototropha TaxID=3003348 RepID=A0A8T7M5V7_9CHLR|nr:LysM peptidoglycan-binding domain-containing protein [Chloroflexota bacterium]WJW69400.1 LysM peptidoglycan-binding domain-containing protein [Chloroflexota bacterium L227-S17]